MKRAARAEQAEPTRETPEPRPRRPWTIHPAYYCFFLPLTLWCAWRLYGVHWGYYTAFVVFATSWGCLLFLEISSDWLTRKDDDGTATANNNDTPSTKT